MKKIGIGALIICFVLVVSGFILNSSINSKINAKIDELNKNGFYVTYEKDSKFLTTKGKGKIEISYPSKAIEYLISKKDDGALKKELEEFLKIIPSETKYDLMEGLTFEYDFSLCNINSKLDLNLYLVSLSNRSKYDFLTKYSYGYAPQNFEKLLQNRELKININEEGKFKINDFSFVSTSGILILRGINGDKSKLNIPFMKFELANYDMGYLDNRFLIENTTFSYNEDKNNKRDSKLDIGNLIYEGLNEEFNIKNLKLSSNFAVNNNDLKGETKISFDEFNSKYFEYSYTSEDKDKTKKDFITVKNSSLVFEYDKLPYEKYKEFSKSFALGYENFLSKQKDFLEALSKSNLILKISADSENLIYENNNWYKKLKVNSDFELSKNLSSMKFDNLNDVFNVLKIDIEVDSLSAQKALENSNEDIKSKVKFIDSANKDFKLLKLELKADGIYINDVLSITKDKLKFPKNSFDDAYAPNSYLDDTNISHTYEMIDKNTLRVNFKYKTSLDSLSSGGIAVSFPQLVDDKSIKAKTSKNFAKLDVYKKGDTMFSGLLNKNVVAEYLMIEGFDENWTDTTIEKEFSLDIDVSNMNDFLEINLRGYSTAADKVNYELLPTQDYSSTQDQQSYYIKIADIDLQTLKKNK